MDGDSADGADAGTVLGAVLANSALTLSQLRVFTAVSRCQSFAAAADLLMLSQPNVSEQIKRAEETLGVKLVRRTRGSRSVGLTEAGQVVLAACERVFGALGQMDHQLQAIRTGDQGVVTFGTEPVFGGYLLPRILRDFQTLHPGVSVAAGINLSSRMIEEVREQRLDLAVIVGNFNLAGMQADPLGGYNAVCVARAGRYSTAPLSLADLRREPWILPRTGFILREQITDLAAGAGISLNAALELDAPEARLHAALEGLGIAPLADQVVADGLASGMLDRLHVEGFPLRVDWRLVSHSYDLSPAADAFRDHLLAACQQLSAQFGAVPEAVARGRNVSV